MSTSALPFRVIAGPPPKSALADLGTNMLISGKPEIRCGETRQSIMFRKKMDARVKPAHDGAN
jgi:hypothetical protein